MRRWWSRRRGASDDDISCREFGRLLQRYLDDMLDVDAARRVEHHMHMCDDCGVEAETYQALRRALRDSGAVSQESLSRLRDVASRIAEAADADHDHT